MKYGILFFLFGHSINVKLSMQNLNQVINDLNNSRMNDPYEAFL